jgi:hypothetical protein
LSPPVSRPFPRFVADSSQESAPYGDLEGRLREAFLAACEPHVAEAGSGPDPESVRWFPERAWGGRVYVPATARGSADDDPEQVEYFGYVSFERPPDGEPSGIGGAAEFTDVTAEENPDWRIDINDDVIGSWRGDGARGGEVTLVWGMPLVRGAVAATAELDGEVLDQAPVADGRFTLVAVDAVKGFGDDLFLEVRLWDRRLRQLAAESLYAEDEGEAAEGPDGEGEAAEEPDSDASRR